MSERWKLIFTRQMRQPEGLFGIVISYILNVINFKQNGLTFQALDIQEQDRILEIGFGNGKYIRKAARQAAHGLVAGIDHSRTMIRSATRRNRKWIARGIVKIKLGSIASIPYADATFDKVYSVNTIYFWPAPAENLQEIYRVLKPGGQLVVTFNSREALARIVGFKSDYVLYEKQEVIDLVTQAGFRDVNFRHRGGKYSNANCVSGVK